jgi:hypothetical protein
MRSKQIQQQVITRSTIVLIRTEVNNWRKWVEFCKYDVNEGKREWRVLYYHAHSYKVFITNNINIIYFI